MGWKGPFTLIAIEGKNCTVKLDQGPVTFRSTAVKPFFEEDDIPVENQLPALELESRKINDLQSVYPQDDIQKSLASDLPQLRRSPRNHVQIIDNYDVNESDDFIQSTDLYNGVFLLNSLEQEILISHEENSGLIIANELRNKGIIKTPGLPFETSTIQQLEGLLNRGVFELVPFDQKTMSNTRIYKARIVNEIKGKTTSKPYEKSRFVVQAYCDSGKESVLT